MMNFQVRQLTAHAYACLGESGRANSGFVIGETGIAVIDTQSNPRDGEDMRKAITSVSRKPVTHVVVTHHHGDHHFGLGCWPEANWLSHPNCTKHMMSIAGLANIRETEVIDPLTLLRLFVGRDVADSIVRIPDHPILSRLSEPEFEEIRLSVPRPFESEDERMIDLGNVAIELRYLGRGHGDDDTTVWVDGGEVVFLGDQGFFGRIPAVASPYVREWTELSESLQAEDSGVIMVPGHGPVGGPADLEPQRSYLTMLLELIEGGSSEDDVRDAFGAWPRFELGHDLNVLVARDLVPRITGARREATDDG